MSKFPYIITGNPGRVELRKEINDLVDEDPLVLNLYLQALRRVQKRDQNERTSYFQIGGIHGMPYKPWDDVSGTKNGYCTHRMVLFPTWHRVYVALIEQVVQDEMRIIAREYEGDARNLFCTAAERFRYPYWDWAHKPTLPEILTSDTVKVQLPPYGTTTTTIENPLQSYRFNPVDDSFEPERFKIWQQTLRCPGTVDSEEGPQATDVSDINKANENLEDEANIRQRHLHIYELMFYVHDWEKMSNASKDKGGRNSLEGVHDGIHLDVGGDAHMAWNEVAGFDPIFFLHHSNVDRLFAIWQHLNPGAKVVPADSGPDDTATIPAHTIVDEQTDLGPFHIDDANFWTSAKTYGTDDFGYTYPEVENQASNAAGRSAVRKVLKQKYGGATLALHSRLHQGVANMVTYKQWVVVASVKPSEFPTSGYIHIFLSRDGPPGPPSEWLHHKSRVGSIALFVNQSPHCDNCNEFREANRKMQGQVFLTDDLLKNGLNVDNISDVETYLINHIHWRCVLIGGKELPLSAVPSLEVRVESATVHEPDEDSDELPTREPFSVHHRVTHGKVGGFSISE